MARITFLSLIGVTLFFIIGCSGDNIFQPASTETGGVNPSHPGLQEGSDTIAGHVFWGMWQVAFDETTGLISAVPAHNAEAHFNLTSTVSPPNCNDCITVQINSFNNQTRILDLNASIRNPTPITGRDVRAIIYTDSQGHKLTNADGWTSLWDVSGGQDINPFKAYAKTSPNRAFPGSAQFTENFLIYIPIPPAYNNIAIAIDASWPGNCKEPYSLENFQQNGVLINQTGAQTDIQVDVLDWQNDVSLVSIEAPAITGDASTPLTLITGNTWGATIQNNMGAPPGEYDVRLMATSAGTGIVTGYDFKLITVTEGSWGGWARTWGAASDSAFDWSNGVAADEAGNSYVIGCFISTVDFDPGPGVENNTAIGKEDIFLSKFDPAGNFVWARTWGGSGTDFGEGITYDPSGFIYLTGMFEATVDFDPGPGSDEHVSSGATDIFLSKFDTDGNLQWVRTWGQSEYTTIESGFGVALDGWGSVYCAGSFAYTADFDPGAGVEDHTSNAGNDAFVSSFNLDGYFQWARTWGGSGEDFAQGIAGRDGQVDVVGTFEGSVDFNPANPTWRETNGLMDVFILSLDEDNSFNWVRTFGGTLEDWCYGVAISETGDFYITGFFTGEVDFDPDVVNVDYHTSANSISIYLSKFDGGGGFQWARTWAGANFYGPGDIRNAVAVQSDNVYVTGWFEGSHDFDPGTGTDMHTSNGNFDACLSKFDPLGEFLWARTWGSEMSDAGQGVTADSLGLVHVTGFYQWTVDFDPGPGTDFHTSNGGPDVFLSQFPTNGDW